jgi:hypothetical protein
MHESLRKKAEEGEYLYVVEVAAKTGDVVVILDYFDKAYAMDKERAYEAVRSANCNWVYWEKILEDDYRKRIRYIRAVELKHIGVGMLGAIGEALIDTALLFPKILNTTRSIKQLFGG